MVPRDRPLIAIGYKNNMQKVISFIVTDNKGRKKAGPTYLSKYPEHFTKVTIWPVVRLLVMSKLFGEVNEVDSRKKIRQSDLALEKFWVTRCGQLRLYTTVSMGMTINNL